MNHRTTTGLLTAGALAASLLLTGCSSSESYNDKTDHCAKAIKDRPDGDKAKPKACAGVTADDYDTLNLGNLLTSSGLVDDNGNVDMNKLIDPTFTP